MRGGAAGRELTFALRHFSSKDTRAAEARILMSVFAAQHLWSGMPFIAAAFAWRPGCGNVAQDCSEPGDRCRVFDPLGESVLDP
jgi:hypothetical protein